MKKLVMFIAVFAAFSFASCKKDRVCTCTITDVTTYTDTQSAGGFTATSTHTETTVTTDDETYSKVKKGAAKKQCLSGTSETTIAGSGGSTTKTTADCKLK